MASNEQQRQTQQRAATQRRLMQLGREAKELLEVYGMGLIVGEPSIAVYPIAPARDDDQPDWGAAVTFHLHVSDTPTRALTALLGTLQHHVENPAPQQQSLPTAIDLSLDGEESASDPQLESDRTSVDSTLDGGNFDG